MPTITDRDTMEKIVSGNGLYPGDEFGPLGLVVRVTEYTNNANERVWGLVYEREAEQGLYEKYFITSEYLHNPTEVWHHPDIEVLQLPGSRAIARIRKP